MLDCFPPPLLLILLAYEDTDEDFLLLDLIISRLDGLFGSGCMSIDEDDEGGGGADDDVG